MLQFSPWKIEQTEFDPQKEVQIEEQLVLANPYISQYAFFEEPYSGDQRVGTFINGVMREGTNTPLEVPNPSVVSLRLGSERLDLNQWKIQKFYRCLHKGQARLERRFTATSPEGFTVEVVSERQLSSKNPHMMELKYTVKFVNYSGLISFMSLLGDAHHTTDWHTLQTYIDEEVAYHWLKAENGDLQVCAAQRHELFKNGEKQTDRPIKIDKRRVLGYAYMTDVVPGDMFTMHTIVAIVDSRDYAKADLPKKAMENVQATHVR